MIRVAWLQLRSEPVRLLAAVAGIGFAALLVFMQLGFREALYRSAVRFHQRLVADLVILSPKSVHIALMESFPRRRVHQARAVPGVASAEPFYAGMALWKNPETGVSRRIFVGGMHLRRSPLDGAELGRLAPLTGMPDHVLFDRASKREYGPIAELFEKQGSVATEVGNHRVVVAGLFILGTSFNIDASILTSDVNFLRLFPDRDAGLVELGLVRLAPGADVERTRAAIDAALPEDVEVLTRDGYMEREKAFWRSTAPVGFIFNVGAIMGLVVGAAIAYQILFAEVSGHVAEYATLKAIGLRPSYLYGIVLGQAAILAALGFVPGWTAAALLYRVTERATLLPLVMDAELAGAVFLLSLIMCAVAGVVALRKVRRADPADVF